jgi:hypothetical protein
MGGAHSALRKHPPSELRVWFRKTRPGSRLQSARLLHGGPQAVSVPSLAEHQVAQRECLAARLQQQNRGYHGSLIAHNLCRWVGSVSTGWQRTATPPLTRTRLDQASASQLGARPLVPAVEPVKVLHIVSLKDHSFNVGCRPSACAWREEARPPPCSLSKMCSGEWPRQCRSAWVKKYGTRWCTKEYGLAAVASAPTLRGC